VETEKNSPYNDVEKWKMENGELKMSERRENS